MKVKKNKNLKFIKDFYTARFNFLVSLFSMFICLSIFLFFQFKKPITIFPSNNTFELLSYTDSINNGNSIISNFSVSDSLIELDYELKGGFINPYIGIMIKPILGKFIDLNFYNRIVFEIDMLNTENFDFVINTVVKKSNKDLIGKPIKLCVDLLDLQQDRYKYVIDFKKLKVPDYWFDNLNISSDTEVIPDYKRVLNVCVGNAFGNVLNEKRSLKIYSISFERDNKQLGFLLAGIVLIINIVLLIIHVLKYNNKNRKVSISIEYKPVEVQEKRAKNIHSICLEYINSHFNDPDFSLERTAIELGFHQRVISNTIQELFKCNFKAYINRIRIHEAKRLLKETNLTIGEIAFEVGFNNQSHFNRVFKASEGVNPSDFKSTEI